MQVYVTAVRTGRGFHAHKGSGGHLSAGHTVDGVVDEDDGDVDVYKRQLPQLWFHV